MRFKQLEWTQDKQGDWTAYGFFGAFYVENTGDEFEGSLVDSNDYHYSQPMLKEEEEKA